MTNKQVSEILQSIIDGIQDETNDWIFSKDDRVKADSIWAIETAIKIVNKEHIEENYGEVEKCRCILSFMQLLFSRFEDQDYSKALKTAKIKVGVFNDKRREEALPHNND